MNRGDHIWYSKWDSLQSFYGVVLEVGDKVLIKLVDGREIWVDEFELSEGTIDDDN